MILTEFDYVKPTTLDEALALLAAGGSRVLAGGQSLLVDLRTGDAPAPGRLIDIRGIDTLRGVRRMVDGGLRIGALTTFAELSGSTEVRAQAPALAEAARSNGDPQVRNLGTAGGNLAAVGRATDLPVAAIAADVTVRLAGPDGELTLSAEEFAATGLPASTIVTGLDVPPGDAARATAFEKTADRATRYPLCAVAVRATRAGDGTLSDCRIAVTGATARALRLTGAEESLRGSAGGVREVLAAFRAQPGDLFVPGRGASAEYLRHLAGVLTARALARAAKSG